MEVETLFVCYDVHVGNCLINFGCFCRRQEEIASEKEEIDRQRKLLGKRRPLNDTGTSRKRGASTSGAHNGAMTTSDGFLKPDSGRELTWQEFYESDEIFKVCFLVVYREFEGKNIMMLLLGN